MTKIALVTGGTRGIGASISQKLKSSNFKVIFVSIFSFKRKGFCDRKPISKTEKIFLLKIFLLLIIILPYFGLINPDMIDKNVDFPEPLSPTRP